MTHTIYTAGYTSHTPDQLYRLAVSLDAVVVDIRYAPRSKWEPWQKEALEALLGDRYRWVHALGNRNYKGGGPIDIVDMTGGCEIVHRLAERQPVILLCACVAYVGCHRQKVAERLERDGYEVMEAVWPARETREVEA